MAALGLAALDFWTSVVVCHTLIVEHGAVEAGGAPAFQARPVLIGTLNSKCKSLTSKGGVPHADYGARRHGGRRRASIQGAP